ncbi:MAG: glycosyl transferase [Paracoccus denitrificans]|nr:MAG: glycosyl transferase [Paracoccus denitrificans]PZO83922.1 MAG: glycosyl transferase [Paracoccus denitrificans]
MPPTATCTVSALTIARGRRDHLVNTIIGLTKQTSVPAELVIGVMGNEPYPDLPQADFPIRQILIPGDELPLAKARNTVAREAVGDVLAFVDVDCIPAPSLIEDYAALCAAGSGLMMGEVMYLPGGATENGVDFDRFSEVAVRHSDRAGPPAERSERCNDYRCFWSLNFAINAADFRKSGGFDERYTGYGGEDTDFGRQLDALDIPISWMQGARVYHQYHPHFMPPVHHMKSVMRNADIFAEKWGHRTMEHWLYCFSLMGLIENTPKGLRILREPEEEHMALCRQQSDQPYANTRRIIDILKARAANSDAHPDDTPETLAARIKAVDQAQKFMLYPAAE